MTISVTAGSGTVIVEKRIATSIDDVEESADGNMLTSSGNIHLVYENKKSGNQTVGLRSISYGTFIIHLPLI